MSQRYFIYAVVGSIFGSVLAALPFMLHSVSSAPDANWHFAGTYVVLSSLFALVGVVVANRQKDTHGNLLFAVCGAIFGCAIALIGVNMFDKGPGLGEDLVKAFIIAALVTPGLGAAIGNNIARKNADS